MVSGGRMASALGPDEFPPPGGRARAAALLGWGCALYGAAILGLCLLLHTASDRWWVATLVLFGPRWPWAVPLAALVPAAAVLRRRLLWLLGVVLVLLLGPLMGLCLPWGAAGGGHCPEGLVVATRARGLRRRGLAHPPARRTLPGQPLPPPAGRAPGRPGVRDRLRRHRPLRARRPGGSARVANLHLASPRRGLLEVIQSRGARAEALAANSALRLRQSEKASRWLASRAGPLLIAGDFNTPPESTVYRRCWSGYANAFSAAGVGFGLTHFTRRTGVRIDHILAGPGWRCLRCWVGPPVGSAHRPVIADLCREAPPG